MEQQSDGRAEKRRAEIMGKDRGENEEEKKWKKGEDRERRGKRMKGEKKGEDREGRRENEEGTEDRREIG